MKDNQDQPRPAIKSIRIRRAPFTCALCSEPPAFWLSYNDPANPGPSEMIAGRYTSSATVMKRACSEHLLAVNELLLREAGLMPEPPAPSAITSEDSDLSTQEAEVVRQIEDRR
jgi:hypothetical protein